MASSLAGPSSHLPLTAGRGRGGRSSAGRKREVVLRLLRREDLDELLDQWSDGDPLLSELWDMAALTRPGVALSKPPVASPRLRRQDGSPSAFRTRRSRAYLMKSFLSPT